MTNLSLGPFGGKDDESGGGGCPSVIRATRDGRPGIVAIGKTLTADQLVDVDNLSRQHDSGIASDEAAVWFPDNVVEKALQLLKNDES